MHAGCKCNATPLDSRLAYLENDVSGNIQVVRRGHVLDHSSSSWVCNVSPRVICVRSELKGTFLHGLIAGKKVCVLSMLNLPHTLLYW